MYAFLPVGGFALGNWPEDPAPADRHGGQAKKPKKLRFPVFSLVQINYSCRIANNHKNEHEYPQLRQ